MKSRVNLYLPAYQPKLELYTLSSVFACLVLLLLVVIFARVGITLSGQSDAEKLSQLSDEVTQQQQFAEELTKQLQLRDEDPELLAIFSGLQVSYKDKQRLKSALEDRESMKSTQFSKLLQALSEQHHDSLWLTHIKVSEDAMMFSGQALKPEAVPQWVGRLGKSEFFDGKVFDEASLTRTDSQLTFNLSTSREDAADDAPVGGQR